MHCPNAYIVEGEFSSELTHHVDIVTIHKKKGKSDKSSDRAVSIHSYYSKVCEKTNV